jgi:two-component system chemotaxis response regulator CheB
VSGGDKPAPVRVMVVEDSLVVRHLLAHIVSRDPRLQLVSSVESAEEAMVAIPRIRPDVISMDVRLPGMDGLEATRRIMTECPTPIVIVARSVEDSTLRISMNALRAGALSVVEKPLGITSTDYERVADDICTQLLIMSQVPVIRRRMTAPSTIRTVRVAPSSMPVHREQPRLLGLAASTGGPQALSRLLGFLPKDYSLPILLVQHMGAPFLEGFASWLDSTVDLKVLLAQDGAMPVAGEVYVAPGDRHLRINRDGVLQLGDDTKIDNQRPAATALFQSMADNVGDGGVGVLLTGMGEDGAQGLLRLRQVGGITITEDASTAVVYGMPAAAVRLGASQISLPLDLIGTRLLQLSKEAA